MSTDVAAAALPAAPRNSSLRLVRVMRFAVCVTFVAAISFAFAWPIHFIAPVLVIVLLAEPIPGVSYRGWGLLASVLAAVVLGTVFTQLLERHAMVFVPLLGLALFTLFYLVNRQGPVIFVLLCLLALIILPMVGQVYDPLIPFAAGYFALSSVVAVLGVCRI